MCSRMLFKYVVNFSGPGSFLCKRKEKQLSVIVAKQFNYSIRNLAVVNPLT